MDISSVHKTEDMHVGGFSQEELDKIQNSLRQDLGIQRGLASEFHELITLHKKNFADNLEKYRTYLEKSSEYSEIAPKVFAHESAIVDRSTIFDTTKGIIVFEKDAKVLPFSYLVGPLRIDEGVIVSSHSNIANSYIGKVSRVGGEIKNTVFESYSNKAHYGFLGDAYVGSWVNIGGGTTFSNVKNTYGTVKMAGKETGEQHMGSIISDHVKTAINTSVYTGKVIGVGAHIYGTVTSDVPNFVNYYSKDNMTKIPIEITEKIIKRMMERRGVEFTDEDKKALELIYKQL